MADETSAAPEPTGQAGGDPAAGSPAAGAPAAVPGAIPDLAALLDARPELADEILRHPRLKQRFEADVQSRSDRLTARQLQAERQRWEQELAAETARTRLKAERKERLAMDPEELGRQVQQEIQQQEIVEPLSERLARQYKGEGWNEGYQASTTEVVRAIERHPVWQKLSIPERQKLVDEAGGELPILNERLAELHGEEIAAKRVEARLAELKQAQERAALAEQRNGRPAPDLGGGPAAGSDAEFLAAFAAGRNDDFARARRLMGT